MSYCDKELLREYYWRDASSGRITVHEVKKAVEHSGGGFISHEHAERLLWSLANWEDVITEHEFVHGIERYVREHGHHWW